MIAGQWLLLLYVGLLTIEHVQQKRILYGVRKLKNIINIPWLIFSRQGLYVRG